MTGFYENELGAIKVSEAIVRKAVAPEIEKPSFLEFANTGRKRDSDLTLHFKGGKVSINLSIAVALDTSIHREAIKLQGKIKRAVEAATGVEVDTVNVHIARVFVPESKSKSTSESRKGSGS